MALEWTLDTELEPAVSFTVADGTGIEKGSLLKLTDPRTAILSTGDIDAVIGIAAEEKVASDGKTTIGVYMRGIFICTAGSSITVGDLLMTNSSTGANNEVIVATAAAVNTKVFAVALETASDTDTLFVLLNVGIGATGT